MRVGRLGGLRFAQSHSSVSFSVSRARRSMSTASTSSSSGPTGDPSSSRGQSSSRGKERVAIVGSGNWGSAIAKIVGTNVINHPSRFDRIVRMYCYEEDWKGRPLSEVINSTHENVKYLPGIKLPRNVVAEPDLVRAVEGATALIFVLPHQFIASTCQTIKGKLRKDGVRAISLTKGVDITEDRINLFPRVIEEILGIPCDALSGANIADEIAREAFAEATVGVKDLSSGSLWHRIFDTPYFRIGIIDDVAGVALGGALKNVVAVAAGFSDGLGFGNNTKAAIMRIGLLEMRSFALEFFEGVKSDTFVAHSAGVADLITSCLGGRNRKCAEAFVRTGKPFEELEKEMLGGQKLQGAITAQEVNVFLKRRGRVDAYPLFKTVYEIAFEHRPPSELTQALSSSSAAKL